MSVFKIKLFFLFFLFSCKNRNLESAASASDSLAVYNVQINKSDGMPPDGYYECVFADKFIALRFKLDNKSIKISSNIISQKGGAQYFPSGIFIGAPVYNISKFGVVVGMPIPAFDSNFDGMFRATFKFENNEFNPEQKTLNAAISASLANSAESFLCKYYGMSDEYDRFFNINSKTTDKLDR